MRCTRNILTRSASNSNSRVGANPRQQSAQFLATLVYYFMSAEVFARQMGLSKEPEETVSAAGESSTTGSRRVTRLATTCTNSAGLSEGASPTSANCP